MRRLTIGGSGSEARLVSAPSLGTVRLRTATDEATSLRILDRYVGAGAR